MPNYPDQAQNNDESIGHDQNFKELISTFFLEFLELFLPELAATVATPPRGNRSDFNHVFAAGILY